MLFKKKNYIFLKKKRTRFQIFTKQTDKLVTEDVYEKKKITKPSHAIFYNNSFITRMIFL